MLGLDRVGLLGPAEPAGEPAEVGVHGDPGDAEGVAEHHVGGLAADAGQLDEVLEPGRDLAVVPLDEGGAELEQRLGLGAEEPERADDPLEGLPVGRRHRRGVGVGREQGRPHRVDPLVGGLRAQHGHDEQLEGVVEVELALRVGVGVGEHPVDPARLPHQPGAGRRDGGSAGHAERIGGGADRSGRPAEREVGRLDGWCRW